MLTILSANALGQSQEGVEGQDIKDKIRDNVKNITVKINEVGDYSPVNNIKTFSWEGPKDPNPDSEEGGEKVIHKGGEVLYDGENLIVVSRISDLEDDTDKATVFLDRGADGDFEDIALVDFGKNYGQEERTNSKYSNLLSKLAKVMEDPEGINPLSLGAVAGISNIDRDLSVMDLEWVSGNSERVRNALGMDSDRPDHQEYKHKILRQAGITDEEINQLTEAYFQVTEQANNALKQASK